MARVEAVTDARIDELYGTPHLWTALKDESRIQKIATRSKTVSVMVGGQWLGLTQAEKLGRHKYRFVFDTPPDQIDTHNNGAIRWVKSVKPMTDIYANTWPGGPGTVYSLDVIGANGEPMYQGKLRSNYQYRGAQPELAKKWRDGDISTSKFQKQTFGGDGTAALEYVGPGEPFLYSESDAATMPTDSGSNDQTDTSSGPSGGPTGSDPFGSSGQSGNTESGGGLTGDLNPGGGSAGFPGSDSSGNSPNRDSSGSGGGSTMPDNSRALLALLGAAAVGYLGVR